MCAPCKVILDEGAAAQAEGGDALPAMMRAGARIADRLPNKVLAALAKADAKFLRGQTSDGETRESYVEALLGHIAPD